MSTITNPAVFYTPDYGNGLVIARLDGGHTANTDGFLLVKWPGGGVNNRLTLTINGVLETYGGTSSFDSSYEGGTILLPLKKGDTVSWFGTNGLNQYDFVFFVKRV